MISVLFNTLGMKHCPLLSFFVFLLPTVVLGVVALGIKLEPVLGVEVALGVGVVPGALLVVDGAFGALLPVDVVPSALLLVDCAVGTLLLLVL